MSLPCEICRPCTYCGFAIACKHPKRCQCWAAIYCDSLCQRRDWRQHKATCIWYAIMETTSLPPEMISHVCEFLKIAYWRVGLADKVHCCTGAAATVWHTKKAKPVAAAASGIVPHEAATAAASGIVAEAEKVSDSDSTSDSSSSSTCVAAPGIVAGTSQHKAQSIAGASSHGRPPFLDLAVRACEQGLANHHLLGEQPQRMKNVCVWMEWMNGHVSPELVSGSSPRVLAALLLHTAWCMEWGDGLPFSKTLVKLVALTRDGPQSCKQLQDGFLFHVMRFLKLTTEDCKDLAGLHCRLLMGLPGTQKGLPKLED